MKEARMYPPRHGLGHAVPRQGLPPTEPDLDDTGFVLDQQANRLPPQLPLACKIADGEVWFEG